MKRMNNDFSTNPPNFVDYSETMKEESIKEELNVEESFDDPILQFNRIIKVIVYI